MANRILIFVGISLAFLFCCTVEGPGRTETKAAQSKPTDSPIAIPFCDFAQDPFSQGNRSLELRGSVYRVNSLTTLGNDDCIAQHPFVEVEFDRLLSESACDEIGNRSALCSLINATNTGLPTGEVVLEGRVIGRVVGFAEPNYGVHGKRVRFRVEEIEIEKTIPMEATRLR